MSARPGLCGGYHVSGIPTAITSQRGHANLSLAMTPEQEKSLSRRLRGATGKQPELKRLKTLLLRFGGEFLVAPPKPDADVPLLLEHGFLTSGPTKLKVMKSSSCHQNMATVWKKRRFGIVAIATGYALSEDVHHRHRKVQNNHIRLQPVAPSLFPLVHQLPHRILPSHHDVPRFDVRSYV
jgi:hypothetical protein